MLTLILRRLLMAIPMLLVVTFFVFVLLALMPGDPAQAIAGDLATPEQVEATRQRLGLDKPLVVQYGTWLLGAVRGDLGTSLFSSTPVTHLIAGVLPVTLSLAGVALVLGVSAGLLAGILAAVRQNSWLDRAISALTSIGLAVPPFVVGAALMVVFAVQLALFPATGYAEFGDGVGDWLLHLILPAIAVAAVSVAELTRQTRGAMIETLNRDYIRTVRAKGMLPGHIVFKHALRNAATPIATVLGLQLSRVLAGAVTVEVVFALHGFGSLAVSSVLQRDLPVILGVVVFSALIVLVSNLIVDISYGLIDPRVRHKR